MKITNRALIRLWVGLHDLDGNRTLGTEAQPQGVIVPYEFGKGVPYAIARNINHLRGAREVVEKTQASLVRMHSGGKEAIETEHANFAKFQAEIDEMLDTVVEVESHRIKLENLNPDKNKLRGTTLAALEPIIDAE